MSRHSSGGAYDQWIEYLDEGCYRIHWTVDYYYSGSRCRYPRHSSRITDEKGARRFCKKWGLDMPTKEKRACK